MDAGYDALVIDSLTHAWQFILNAKDDHDLKNPKANTWAAWRKFAPMWEDLMRDLLQAPIHIIATMRSKQAYEQSQKDGRAQVVKLGLQPQVRDGAEYEFGIVFSVNQAHRAEATKDRTALFTDHTLDLLDDELHKSLVGWMNAGGPEAMATDAQISTLRAYLTSDAVGEGARHAVRDALATRITATDATAMIDRVEKYIAKQKNGTTQPAML